MVMYVGKLGGEGVIWIVDVKVSTSLFELHSWVCSVR